MKTLIGTCVVLLACAAQAADRTWTGGVTGDHNWRTAANWGGVSPEADDALLFGGTAKLANTNDFDEGTAFSGLTFSSGAGAFTLNGNGITLGGNVSNNDADAQTINLPMLLPATRTMNASSGNLVVNGVCSGAGGLTKLGGSALFLTGDNTYEGVTAISTGTVVITHANALGSTNGNTTVNTANRGALNLRNNITLGEPLTFTGGSVAGSCLLNETGTNTVSGLITTSGGRYNANGGTWMKLAGGVAGVNAFLVVNANGIIEFTNAPISIGTGTFHADSGGTTILGVSGNTWGSTLFSGGTMRMDVANALPATTTLQIGGVSYGPSCTLNLNGFDQTVASITQAGGTPGTVVITSASPATLTVNQSGTTTYWGQLAGRVSLVKTGSGTLSLSNAVSSTAGDVIVSNGTLVVTAASRLGNSTHIIVAGGTLDLRNQTALSDAATLSLATGAKLALAAGLSERVDRLFLNGVQQTSGTYGSSTSGAFFTDDTYFSGSGQLSVWSSPPILTSAATWDAEGGADTLVSAAANWTNDVLPAFDGTAYATFATGGLTATVDQAVGFYGMAFNRDGNFTLAAGAGSVSNGAGGLFAQVPSTTGRTYTLAEDLLLSDNQTWCITNNGAGGTTLNVTGALDDGPIPYGIRKIGNGTLTLAASNTFDGELIVSEGTLKVSHPHALGSTNSHTTVMGVNGGYLFLVNSLHLTEPLVLNGEKNNAGTLRNDSGAGVLGGPVSILNQVRLHVYGSSLSITGGVQSIDGSGGLFVINSSSTMIFSTKPLNLGLKTFYTDSGGLTVLAVAGNVWPDTMVASGTLRCDVPNALPPSSTLRLGVSYGPRGTFDLNGNDQTVSRLYVGAANIPALRVIKSETPATLTVHQNANDIIDMCFTGAVSLLKSGTGTLTLTNAFTSTSGGFTVTNGTLAVTRDGTFGPNSTNIVVGGSGTLLLSNSVAIADSATVKMPAPGLSTAKISLAAGVDEEVGWLFFGEKMQRVGTYGSSSSTAAVKDDTHFSGTGMLTVLHDTSGTLLKIQ
jgi:autotransporter-associated beta strand protein